jgi:predicted small lipoprotein YifL
MFNVSLSLSRVRQRVRFGTVSLILGSAMLAGCGYKGPLYLPPPPDTLGDQRQQSNPSDGTRTTPPLTPGMQTNPSLEPNPIVIE